MNRAKSWKRDNYFHRANYLLQKENGQIALCNDFNLFQFFATTNKLISSKKFEQTKLFKKSNLPYLKKNFACKFF